MGGLCLELQCEPTPCSSHIGYFPADQRSACQVPTKFRGTSLRTIPTYGLYMKSSRYRLIPLVW